MVASLNILVEAVSEGGNRFSLRDQKSVGGDAQCCVMVKAAPTSPLEMAKANLLFEVMVVALNAPAQFDHIDELTESNVAGSVENQFGRHSSPSGHSISSHSS